MKQIACNVATYNMQLQRVLCFILGVIYFCWK